MIDDNNPEETGLSEEFLAELEQARQRTAALSRDSALDNEREACLRIQELREARGWSQSDLARKLSAYGFDMHQTTVAKLEKGKRPLRFAEATVLARIFGLPAAALFFMPVEGEPPEITELREDLRRAEEFERVAEDRLRTVVEAFATDLAKRQADRLMLSEQLRRIGEHQATDERDDGTGHD